VHAVRVATRRILALRTLVGFLASRASVATLERHLTVAFRPCGRLRDLQLMTREVAVLCVQYPEAKRFLLKLRKRRRRARRRAAIALRKARPHRVAQVIASIGCALDIPAGARSGREQVVRRIGLQVSAARRAADAAFRRAQCGDLELIHHARLALKSLRYVTEIAGSLGLSYDVAELSALIRAQASIGTINDRALLLEALDAYRERHPKAGKRLARVRSGVARAQRRQLQQFQAAAGTGITAARLH